MTASRDMGFVERFLLELKRDRKKTATLGILTMVAVFFGIRLALQNTPAEVEASVNSTSKVQSVDSSAPVSPFSSGEEDQNDIHEYLAQAGREISRDIFSTNLEMFPLDPNRQVTENVVSTPRPVATPEQLIRQQAASLMLQSTIASSSPTVIINGRVLKVGDWISNFQVVEIFAGSCIVEQNGVQVVLEMKN